MQIRLFAVNFVKEPDGLEAEQSLRLMPEERRIRLMKVKNPRARAQTLYGYALLRYASEQAFGCARLPEIEYGDHGKPRFLGVAGMEFSISHTRAVVLCAVGDTPMGTDIERIRPIRAAMARRFMGKEEYEQLQVQGEAQRRFFESWVLRESMVKWSGAGLSKGIVPAASGDSPGYFRLFDDIDGCCAAIYSVSKELPDRIELVDEKALWR